MLIHSFFRVTCVCGEELRSEGKTGRCPACKREFVIEWPADYESQQQKEPGAAKTVAA
jgi:tRNA(Ile2) C34 agmatinyltransferase TiaS